MTVLTLGNSVAGKHIRQRNPRVLLQCDGTARLSTVSGDHSLLIKITIKSSVLKYKIKNIRILELQT